MQNVSLEGGKVLQNSSGKGPYVLQTDNETEIPPHPNDAVKVTIDERAAIASMPPQRLRRRTLGTVVRTGAVDIRDRRGVLMDGALEGM